MPRPMHKTTALPRTLRDELGIKDTYGEKKRRRNGPATRKERRKEERTQKRGRHAPPSHMNRKRSHRDDDDEDEEDDFGGSDLGSDESQSEREERSIKKPAKPTKSTEQPKSILKKSKKSDVSDEQEDEPVKTKLPKAVKEKLEQDDAEIAALEKRLGIKGKKLPKSFQEDGLDELLGDLGGDSDVESKKRKREADDWLQMKRRKAQGLASDEEDESDSDPGSDDGLSDLLGGLDEDEEENEDDIDLDESEDGVEEDYEESGSDEEEDNFEGFDDEEEAPKKVRENPYVAPVSNRESKQKYIPPSLRAQSTSESESLTRLRRQAQGHLNKLSEANLVSILAEIEKLYREHPRQNVTSTLTTLLLNLLSERSVLQDTFVILHAGFIAAIYKVIGMDFGAEIVQKLVETFDKGGDERGAFEGKETINLMSLLSQLYNFQVVGSTLVFDYIRMFLEKITESNTELLLKIIRSMTQISLTCPREFYAN